MALAGPLDWHDRAAGRQEADPTRFGDVVLARRDIATSYHLAVTLDDARQGVSLVTRGEDLFAASHVHRLLQALLDLPRPDWHHHALIRDETGTRLAKRHDAIGDVRGRGLFLGVELVEDRVTRAPATTQAATLLEFMKTRGVLLSTDGPFHCVLKIKPPLVFGHDDARCVVDGLDAALTGTS